jgi:DHA2 family multidrug resistance protein-like MFS transporter
MTVADVLPRAGRREWIGLAVLALPTLLLSIDFFVLLLALPHLSVDLGAGSIEQLWITDTYGFVLAGFLVTMGTLGDRIGRRKLMLIGAAGFAAASLMAAYSTSPEMLIAARGLLGLAGATVMPATLALIRNMFKDPKQMAFAISVWMTCLLSGAAIGPMVGGVMLENFWWGSVFLLGVPVMVLLLILGPLFLPEYSNPDAGRLDLVSVALSVATLLPAIWGLKELAKNGLTFWPAAALVVGIVFGVLFVRRQRRHDNPLLDLNLFRDKAFSAALIGMLLGVTLLGSVMMFITQYLQLVGGLSPLETALWMLPAVAASITGVMLAPVLGRRIRPAYAIGGGLVLSIVGLLVVTQVSASGTGGVAAVIVGYCLNNMGAGPLVALGTGLVLGSVPPERAGSAAALSETSNEFGYALGIAVLGSIGAVVYRGQIGDNLPAGLSPAAADASRDTLAGAVGTAQSLPGDVGNALVTAGREAFTSGLHIIAWISAILMAGGIVLVATMLRDAPRLGQEQAPAEATETEADAVTTGDSTKVA